MNKSDIAALAIAAAVTIGFTFISVKMIKIAKTQLESAALKASQK